MYSIFKTFGVTAIIALASTALAHAQTEYAAQYKAYNEALEAGDYPAAEAYAENAWRAAESELGDHQTTAILAYNFANLIYYTRPASAVEPLMRIPELIDANSDFFGVESPELMQLFVEAAIDKESREKERALRKALNELEEGSAQANLLSARGWLHIAARELTRKRYQRAETSADFSIRHYRAYEMLSAREVTDAYILGGITRVAGNSRNIGDLQEAVELFEEAINLFPPQSSIETFNPQLAIALTWQAAARAAAITDARMTTKTGSPRLRKDPDLDINAKIRWDPPKPAAEDCLVEWEERKIPKFPNTDAAMGRLGAVLVGYDIEDNRTRNAKILAEVPFNSRFGEVSLNAVKEWTLVEMPPPECRSNILTTIHFIF